MTSLPQSQTLRLRQEYIAGSCQLHYDRSPLKIVRSQGQFLYDDAGCKYLDCTSTVNNVGYCHPATVKATCDQMATLSIGGAAHEEYSKEILATLPSSFQTCLFTNSGAEANDLALQLAKRYTNKPGVAVVDGAFHGCSDSLINITPRFFNAAQLGKKPWVYTIPCPHPYLESHASCDEYIRDAKSVIDSSQGQIGCFISEVVLVICGMIIPPASWLQEIYSYVRAAGGIVIADEIQTGMGRSGHLWASQAIGVVPDIITVGKPMGNGHPLAAVITSFRIAAGVTDQVQYRCGAVEAAVGMSVLRVLRDERLLENCIIQGQRLEESITLLKKTRHHIGDVRGLGLLLGVEMVSDADRTPDAELAEKLAYRLKDEGVLVANGGKYRNVLLITPPLCITSQDVDVIASKLDKALGDLELMESQEVFDILNPVSPPPLHTKELHTYSFSSSEDSCSNTPYNFYDSLD